MLEAFLVSLPLFVGAVVAVILHRIVLGGALVLGIGAIWALFGVFARPVWSRERIEGSPGRVRYRKRWLLDGEIQVRARWLEPKGSREGPNKEWILTHSTVVKPLVVSRSPLEVRAVAEGLCKLGRMPLRWREPGMPGELRSPDALDAPFVERLRQSGEEPEPGPPPRKVRITLQPDESIELQPRRGKRSEVLGALGVTLVAGTLAWFLGGDFWWTAAFCALFFIYALFDWSADVRYRVSRRGVEATLRLGRWRKTLWRMEAKDIESIYGDTTEHADGCLTLMSDRTARRLRFRTPDDVIPCYAVLTRALAGYPQAPGILERPALHGRGPVKGA